MIPTRLAGARQVSMPIVRVRRPRACAALFSCSAGEKAFENDALKHGVFFHYVIEGLKSKTCARRAAKFALSGCRVTFAEQVPTKVAEISGGREQSPNLKADIAGRPPVLLSKLVVKAVPTKIAESKPEVKPELKKEPADSDKSPSSSKFHNSKCWRCSGIHRPED